MATINEISEKIRNAGMGLDQLPGGIADGKNPGDFDPDALEKGIRVEMEHTDDESIAKEIAMDHLSEDPEYYDKLEKMEREDGVNVAAFARFSARPLRMATATVESLAQMSWKNATTQTLKDLIRDLPKKMDEAQKKNDTPTLNKLREVYSEVAAEFAQRNKEGKMSRGPIKMGPKENMQRAAGLIQDRANDWGYRHRVVKTENHISIIFQSSTEAHDIYVESLPKVGGSAIVKHFGNTITIDPPR